MISLLGALMEWRMAIGISTIIPILSLIGLPFCPETPVWLLKRGEDEKMMKSLKFLRGKEEVVKAESESLIQFHRKEQKCPSTSKAKQLIDLFRRPSFLKPFLLGMFMLLVGVDLSGFVALAFYLVKIVSVSHKFC